MKLETGQNRGAHKFFFKSQANPRNIILVLEQAAHLSSLLI